MQARDFEALWPLPPPAPGQLLVLFAGERLLLHSSSRTPYQEITPALLASLPAGEAMIPLGLWQGKPVHVLSLPQDFPVAGSEPVSLRHWLPLAEAAAWELVSTARQWLHWQADHLYCGRCGGPTRPHARERTLYCPLCDHRYFPRLAPCIIVAICRPGEILLARAPHYPPGLFSLIAGFIEPGESAEAAAVREAREETGLLIGDLHYLESQSWPFPHQLMLGFTANALDGDLNIQLEELTEAAWFPLDSLPQVPGLFTIAGRLIQHVVRSGGLDGSGE